tara:strand:+ start:287 stop:880 length:594 start_codon:yes stop_codon:yes gene_type:complete
VKNSLFLLLFLVLLCGQTGFAQQDSVAVVQNEDLKKATKKAEEKEKDYEPYNALAPSKAAFYSAILPGLGQAYNGSYWKIPIAYAGIGTGVYFYLQNDKEYDKYRNAYKARLAGKDDEYKDRISTAGLRRAQELYQKNKEISILVTLGVYVLNIIDANVEAHLRQFNVDENLSFRPKLDYDQLSGKTNYGLTLNLNF